MTAVSAKDLLRMRLHSQRITANPPLDVVGVVQQLLAIQAQDFAQALWAIGSRSPGSTRADVLAALESGAIVRSWPLRGTLEFVTAQDLSWMLPITTARTIAGAKTRQRQLGLDDQILDTARGVAIENLSGGRAISRDEFFAVLREAGVSTDGQRGVHIVWYLAQTGLVCWGPPAGTQQALVLVQEWLAPAPTVDRDEALRRLVLRYFTGHGPATIADLCWWARLTVADAKTGLALASGELSELVFGGTSYYASIAEVEAAVAGPRAPSLFALSGFDEYLLGYTDRTLALSADEFERVVPGSNGIFKPMIVAKGRVVGTWRHVRTSTSVSLAAEPFEPLSATDAARFDRESDRYSRFWGSVQTLR